MSGESELPRWAGERALRSVVFDAPTLARRVAELGAEITAAYPDGDLLLIGLLKGSFVFLADLVRRIERPLQLDFLVARSYGMERASSGVIRVLYQPMLPLAGKHILVVEDIIDSGRTLSELMTMLRGQNPRSLSICALLDKGLAPAPPELRFLGFRAPPVFLVGYGLDSAENFRHLPFIADVDIDG
jgi:hypoxanthine phosphoribosyltransferase